MNFKNIVWFIKAISNFVLQRSLGNDNDNNNNNNNNNNYNNNNNNNDNNNNSNYIKNLT